MKKQRLFIISKGHDNPKYLHTTGISFFEWVTDKDEATRFTNERGALDKLQAHGVDGLHKRRHYLA